MLEIALAVVIGWLAGFFTLLGLLFMLALQSPTGSYALWVEV